MKSIIVIPSRYGSTRFPGKPLAMISGRSLLERVWLIAQAVKGIDQVYIATDDERIRKHAEQFGANVVMTSPECANGTERAFAVLQSLPNKPEIIINFQGDAVLTPPHVLQALFEAIKTSSGSIIATPAVKLNPKQLEEIKTAQAKGDVGGTFVVFDRKHMALYFSRALVPNVRDGKSANQSIFKHIGIYAYTRKALEEYLKFAPTPLEQAEKLEQLRALENGLPIKVVEVDYRNKTAWSVDTPEDLKMVEQIIAREGEILVT